MVLGSKERGDKSYTVHVFKQEDTDACQNALIRKKNELCNYP